MTIGRTEAGDKAAAAERMRLACLVCELVWGDPQFALAVRALIAGGEEAKDGVAAAPNFT